MDHIPEPQQRGSLLQRLTFPLRCDPNGYDNGPLETYPERRGFRTNSWGDLKFANILTLPDGSRPSVEHSTALLQEWLFNGRDYVKVSDGTAVLTLGKLPQHANLWFTLEGERPEAARKQHFRHIQEHLIRALLFLTNNFTSDPVGSISRTGTPDNIVREDSRIAAESNLEILLLVLLEAMDSITRATRFRERKRWAGSGSATVSLSIHQWMNSLHWCPSELSYMDLTFDCSSFCFANRVVRQNAKVGHSRCTSSKCLAYDLEVSTCHTAHAEPCKGCNNVSFSSAELESLLVSPENSGIPRVKIKAANKDKVKACLTDSGDYVAISHVWSDGLGHPPGVNALPECQIRRLHRLVLGTGLKEPIVWIDALCIPAKNGPGKRNALAQMANVYRNASNVLVLDSDLLSTPSSSCNEELLLRIALSKWMRRLWTLEEGVVARSQLLFQFSDQSMPLPAPHKSLTNNIAFNCAELIAQYLPAEADMLSVITSLHFRSTSWSADEPLCIGYIMGVDVTSIINTDDEYQRMLQLYRLLSQKEHKFPWQFLFTAEEKLAISPFRWAPASLLNLEPRDVFYLQGMRDSGDNGVVATQTDRGLQFQCKHSCLLSFPEGANINKCMILRIHALSYMLCPVPKGGNCRSHTRFWEGADKERCLSTDPTQDWTATWQAQYGVRPTGNWGLVCSEGGGSHGVMVVINEVKEKTLYATFVGQVQMYELQTEHSSIVNVNKEFWGVLGFRELDEEEVRQEQERVEREVFDEKHYNFVNCDLRLAESVTWCIG